MQIIPCLILKRTTVIIKLKKTTYHRIINWTQTTIHHELSWENKTTIKIMLLIIQTPALARLDWTNGLLIKTFGKLHTPDRMAQEFIVTDFMVRNFDQWQNLMIFSIGVEKLHSHYHDNFDVPQALTTVTLWKWQTLQRCRCKYVSK